MEAKKFLYSFCCISGLYPIPALSKTHLCFPNMTSKLFLLIENFASEFFKSLISFTYLSKQLQESVIFLSLIVEILTFSFVLEIETSFLRRSNSLFNLEISFSKFEIVFFDDETNFASLIYSLLKSANSSCNSSKEIDKLFEDVTSSSLS